MGYRRSEYSAIFGIRNEFFFPKIGECIINRVNLHLNTICTASIMHRRFDASFYIYFWPFHRIHVERERERGELEHFRCGVLIELHSFAFMHFDRRQWPVLFIIPTDSINMKYANGYKNCHTTFDVINFFFFSEFLKQFWTKWVRRPRRVRGKSPNWLVWLAINRIFTDHLWKKKICVWRFHGDRQQFAEIAFNAQWVPNLIQQLPRDGDTVRCTHTHHTHWVIQLVAKTIRYWTHREIISKTNETVHATQPCNGTHEPNETNETHMIVIKQYL